MVITLIFLKKVIKAYAGDENGIARLFFSGKAAYALFYSDGSLVFQNTTKADTSKTLTATYKVKKEYDSVSSIPWNSKMSNITSVIFATDIPINSLANHMYNAKNLISVNIITLNINNITNMYQTYCNCYKLTGSPVCGNKVTDMNKTYCNCYNLTGNPVCGPKVTDMSSTYFNCQNLTGSPVCGDNVTSMEGTYEKCTSLTGSPACGPNVTSMRYTYTNCHNLTGNGYFYSSKVNVI